jgi:zinc transporter 1/2/3
MLASCLLQAIEVFIGIIIHKTVIGLSLGIAFVTSKSNICLALVLTIIFVVSSPVGIAIGLGIHTHTGDSSASRVTSAVLEAIACGTFIYITFLELIGHEFSNVQSSNARHQLGLVLCAVLGFCLLAGLTFLPH